MSMTDLLADIAMRSQIMQEARRTEESESVGNEDADTQESVVDELRRDPAPIVGLADDVWTKWLSAINPDSLVVLLVDAPEALRERVVASLDESSQAWLKDNIALLTQVTSANARTAWSHAWEVFDALPIDDREQDRQAPEDNQLRASIVQLLKLHEQGALKWSDSIAACSDPLLAAALGATSINLQNQDLASQLDALKAEHIELETRRADFIMAAMKSAAAGEPAEDFIARWQLGD